MTATLAESTLHVAPSATSTSTMTRWAGRVVTGIAVLFLVFDTAIKLAARRRRGIHVLVTITVPQSAPIGAQLPEQ